jgi:hypothetical protein
MIGELDLPKTRTVSLKKQATVLGSQPRCLWQLAQYRAPTCGPLGSPTMTAVPPHSHGLSMARWSCTAKPIKGEVLCEVTGVPPNMSG